MTQDTGTCEPVFIVGMNGSGTSMMLDSLGRHPLLYAVPHETLMMPYIIKRAGRFGELADDRNFRRYAQFAIDNMPVLRRLGNGERPQLSENWRTWPHTVEGMFDGIFSAFAQKQGKQRWCEKTPDHVQHLSLLAAAFPQARFIHLIRDGREVASSINRRQGRQPELVMYRWKKLVGLGRTEGGNLGQRYLELRYEDLTRDPQREMIRVCEFLNLKFDEQVLQSRMPESARRKEILAGAEVGRIRSNPVKWPQYFDESAKKRLETIGGAMLQKLSYPIQYQAGDADPAETRLRYWRASDFVRLTIRRLTARNRTRSWIKVANSVRFSVKQYQSKHF